MQEYDNAKEKNIYIYFRKRKSLKYLLQHHERKRDNDQQESPLEKKAFK